MPGKMQYITDNGDLRRVFNFFYPALISFASNYIDQEGACEDIIQEVFISLWERRERFATLESIKGFLYVSVRNSCLNYLKHKRIEDKYIQNQATVNESDLFHEWVIKEEVYRRIYRIIGEMAPRTRKILIYHLSGLSNEDISRKTGISINTVKTLKTRAYKVLKRLMGEGNGRDFLLFTFL